MKLGPTCQKKDKEEYSMAIYRHCKNSNVAEKQPRSAIMVIEIMT
jgi:hypothetical protein